MADGRMDYLPKLQRASSLRVAPDGLKRSAWCSWGDPGARRQVP